MVTFKCRRHPQYKAIREPRVGCIACWRLWQLAKPTSVVKVVRDG